MICIFEVIFLSFLLCGRTEKACSMVNSLRKVDFSHPTGHYTWENFRPPLRKSWVRPWQDTMGYSRRGRVGLFTRPGDSSEQSAVSSLQSAVRSQRPVVSGQQCALMSADGQRRVIAVNWAQRRQTSIPVLAVVVKRAQLGATPSQSKT